MCVHAFFWRQTCSSLRPRQKDTGNGSDGSSRLSTPGTTAGQQKTEGPAQTCGICKSLLIPKSMHECSYTYFILNQFEHSWSSLTFADNNIGLEFLDGGSMSSDLQKAQQKHRLL